MGTRRILLVQESATQRARLASSLEQAQYQVAQAGGAEEALSLAQSHPPDLVVSDASLSEQDGFSLCNSLRGLAELSGLPVLILTGLSDAEAAMRALQSGASGLLLKPFAEEELVAEIELLLSYPSPSPEQVEALPVKFLGQDYQVKATRAQAVSLLLSTFDSATRHHKQANKELLGLKMRIKDLERQLAGAESAGAESAPPESAPAPVDLWSIRQELGQALVYSLGNYHRGLIRSLRMGLSAMQGQEQHMAKIEQLVAQMESFDLFAMDASTLMVRSANFNLAGCIQGILENFPIQQHLTQKNLQIEVNCPAELTCNADARLIRVAITELLKNACQASPNSSSLSIVAQSNGPTVNVVVNDPGPGILPANLELSKSRFFSAWEGGVGLGLYLVDQVAAAHSGSLSLENLPGGGFRASFSFAGAV